MIQKIQTEIARRVNSGQSQANIAKQLKLSSAYITQIVQGNTEKLGEKTLRQIAKAFGLSQNASWAIINSKSYVTTQNVCEEAKEMSRMMSCVGETGYGKTTAFVAFERKTPQTFYLLCEFTFTQTQFLKALCTAIGIDDNGNKSELINRIASTLLAHEKPLIILDDAGKLNESVFPLIQLIFDKTEGNAGIVLGGTHALKNKMDKACRADRGGFRELYRRIGYWQHIEAPKNNEIQMICTHFNITDETVIMMIKKRAQDFGTLREYITNLIRLANGEPVTIEMAQAVRIGV